MERQKGCQEKLEIGNNSIKQTGWWMWKKAEQETAIEVRRKQNQPLMDKSNELRKKNELKNLTEEWK